MEYKGLLPIIEFAPIDRNIAVAVGANGLCIYELLKLVATLQDRPKITVGDTVYYELTALFIIEQLPIIRISTRQGIHRHMVKLIAAGLVEAYPNNQKEHVSFFTFGKMHFILQNTKV